MNVEDSDRLVQRLLALAPVLALEVTRPRGHGQHALGTAPERDVSTVSAQGDAAVAAGGAVEPRTLPPNSSEATPEQPESAPASADKSVLMEVLAELHAQGLLSNAELAAKLTQVAAQG